MAQVTNIHDCGFISDLHLNSFWINQKKLPRGVTLFERDHFKSIEEHDEYIIASIEQWCKKNKNKTLWILGDFGDVEKYSGIFLVLKSKYDIKINFVYGNHEKAKDKKLIENLFDSVFSYPIYIARRIILSHEPIYPVPEGCINIHGHLHNCYLDSDQHVCVSAHYIDYQPYNGKRMDDLLQSVKRASTQFLYAPYAEKYVFTRERENTVIDPTNGKIDLVSSRILNKILKDADNEKLVKDGIEILKQFVNDN